MDAVVLGIIADALAIVRMSMEAMTDAQRKEQMQKWLDWQQSFLAFWQPKAQSAPAKPPEVTT